MQAIKATNFFPVLTTTKLTECRDFYTQHFGFAAVFETDWYIHLASEVGIQLGLLQPNHPTQPDFLHTAYGGNSVIYSFIALTFDQSLYSLTGLTLNPPTWNFH